MPTAAVAADLPAPKPPVEVLPPSEDAALDALAAVADSDLGRRYPGMVAVWERAWERFTPFLAFPPAVRKIIYPRTRSSR